jgi:hypothetical protein
LSQWGCCWPISSKEFNKGISSRSRVYNHKQWKCRIGISEYHFSCHIKAAYGQKTSSMTSGRQSCYKILEDLEDISSNLIKLQANVRGQTLDVPQPCMV